MRRTETAHWAGDAVRARLGDLSPAVRRAAAEAVGFLGLVEGAEQLVAALDDPVEMVRLAAVESLGALRPRGWTGQLLRVLPNESDPVRTAILLTLTRRGANPPTKAIVPFLSAPAPKVRIAATQALAAAPRPGTSVVLSTMVRDPDRSVRSAARDGLSALADSRCLPELAAILRSGEEGIERWEIVPLVAKLGGAVTAPILSERLDDSSPPVRSAAIRALGQLGFAGVRGRLEQLLTQDADSGVRAAAATTLGVFEDPGSSTPLLEALQTRWEKHSAACAKNASPSRVAPEERAEYRAIVSALIRIGSSSCLVPILRGLSPTDDWLWAQLDPALPRLIDADHVSLILELLPSLRGMYLRPLTARLRSSPHFAGRDGELVDTLVRVANVADENQCDIAVDCIGRIPGHLDRLTALPWQRNHRLRRGLVRLARAGVERAHEAGSLATGVPDQGTLASAKRVHAVQSAEAEGIQTVLDPPPAHPSVAHDESTRPEWA